MENSGFANYPKQEHNDCTVRAYSKVADIPYSFAYDVIANLGRKPGGLFPFSKLTDWDESFSTLPVLDGEKRLTHRRGTVRRFLRDHPKGSYVVRVPQHVFAVVDGVVYDGFEPTLGQFVRCAWEYKK